MKLQFEGNEFPTIDIGARDAPHLDADTLQFGTTCGTSDRDEADSDLREFFENNVRLSAYCWDRQACVALLSIDRLSTKEPARQAIRLAKDLPKKR